MFKLGFSRGTSRGKLVNNSKSVRSAICMEHSDKLERQQNRSVVNQATERDLILTLNERCSLKRSRGDCEEIEEVEQELYRRKRNKKEEWYDDDEDTKMEYRWTSGKQEAGGRDRRQYKKEQAYKDSLVEDLSEDFRMPINQRPTENVDLDNVEQASLDTQLSSSNIGFKLLQKMGWKGKGLGKDEQGITEPIKSGIRDPRLGIGKQEEDDFFTAEENIQRKKLDVELEETEENVKKREVLAEREQKIQTEVKEIRKVFYCDLCNKQYKLAMEFEAHLSSYDHNHRKRFKQMKEMHGSSSRDDRQKREQQRQERELAKFAQIADAQKQQRLQLQQESGSAASVSSESKIATALTDQEQRNTLKFGFSSKGGASKKPVLAKKENVAKKKNVPVASIFGNDSDEEK